MSDRSTGKDILRNFKCMDCEKMPYCFSSGVEDGIKVFEYDQIFPRQLMFREICQKFYFFQRKLPVFVPVIIPRLSSCMGRIFESRSDFDFRAQVVYYSTYQKVQEKILL